MANLNFVDFIIIFIFLASIFFGFIRGIVRELISLGALIAALIIATLFASPMAAHFTSSAPVQSAMTQVSSVGVNAAQPISYIAIGISFALIFVFVLILGTVFGYIINAFFQYGLLGLGNSVLGALFGFVRGFLINLVLIFLVQLSSPGNGSWWQGSQLVNAFQPSVHWLGKMVSPSLSKLEAKLDKVYKV